MDTLNMVNTDTDKLEHFVKAVNKEIDKEITQIINEAESSRKAIVEAAKDESLAAAYNMIQENIKKVSSKYVKIIAKAELDCKKAVLVKRENLACQVFGNIRDRLRTFRESAEYLPYLIRQAKAEEITEKAVICLRPDDMKYAQEIKNALALPVELKEDATIKLGGLSILYPEQGVVLDKTMDLALSEQREIFNEKNCFSQGESV